MHTCTHTYIHTWSSYATRPLGHHMVWWTTWRHATSQHSYPAGQLDWHPYTSTPLTEPHIYWDLIVSPQHVLGNLRGRPQEEKEHIVRYAGMLSRGMRHILWSWLMYVCMAKGISISKLSHINLHPHDCFCFYYLFRRTIWKEKTTQRNFSKRVSSPTRRVCVCVVTDTLR